MEKGHKCKVAGGIVGEYVNELLRIKTHFDSIPTRFQRVYSINRGNMLHMIILTFKTIINPAAYYYCYCHYYYYYYYYYYYLKTGS